MCRDFQECIDESMVDYTNRALAEKAWFRHKHLYCDIKYIREFKDGFIQGYLEVATGGTGCTPLIAPSNYWGWRYQSPHGQQAINAWFQGFPLGVKAAEEDGVGHWQQIQMHGVNTLGNPVGVPMYGSGIANPFDPNSGMAPVPEIIQEGSIIELDQEAMESENVDETEIPNPQPLPEADASASPTIESPSDVTDLVSGRESSDSDAIRAVLGEDDGIDDTSVFGNPAPAPAAESDLGELPFKFE